MNFYIVYSRFSGYIETVSAESAEDAINKILNWYPQFPREELFAEEFYDE